MRAEPDLALHGALPVAAWCRQYGRGCEGSQRSRHALAAARLGADHRPLSAPGRLPHPMEGQVARHGGRPQGSRHRAGDHELRRERRHGSGRRKSIYLKADTLDPFGFSGWVGPEPHGSDPLRSGSCAGQGKQGRDPAVAAQVVQALKDAQYVRRGDPVVPHGVVHQPA